MNESEIEAFLDNSDLDDEIPCGTASEEEEDEVSELGSVYDCNISSSTDTDEASELQERDSEIFPSKNGKYFWSSSSESSAVGRYSRENVMNTSPGATRYAIARTNGIKSSFSLFMPNLPRSSPAKAALNTLKETSPQVPQPSNLKRSRCFMCPSRSNSTKYSTKCSNCQNFVCKLHSETKISCNNCSNNA